MRSGRATMLSAALLLIGCSSVGDERAASVSAVDTTNVQTYAKSVLNSLQPPSFAEGREFCGYIFVDESGSLAHTVARGTVDFCDYNAAPATTVASYHTHGNFAEGYDSEIPSVDDLSGSVEIGFDDYLGTPGGRFWINGANGVSRLICGQGCLKSDPNYRPDPLLPVDNQYTLGDLRNL